MVVVALGLLLVLALEAVAPGAPVAGVPPAEPAQLWLLEVRLGQQILADALAAQQRGDHILVPLGELCRLLDFAVEIDVVRGQASGFVLSEDRRFWLDAKTRVVIVDSRRIDILPGQIEQADGEIYVDTRTLSRWLPIDVAVDLPSAALVIHPRELLPLQERLERERRARVSGGTDLADASYPRSELPYRPWSVPFMDLRALGSIEPAPRTGNVGADQRASGNYSALLTGDLLFMDSTIQAVGADTKPLDTLRVTLGRKDPDGHLLGPLGAREVSVGEVSYPGSDLLAYSAPGTGFLLSSAPLNRPSEFDRHTFRGPLPVGWDVELYHNDALVGYQQSRSDGRYEFDVAVSFDLNDFRLVFYGPEGQKREERTTFNIGQTLTPRGEVRYRLSAAAPTDHGLRSLLGLEVGLARNLSAAVEGATVELADGRHAYGKAALFGTWSRLFATGTVVADERGGWGSQATAQLRLEGVGLTLKRLYLVEFHSERLPETFGLVHNRTSLRIDGSPLPHLPVRIPLMLEATKDDLASGLSVRTLAAQIAASSHGFALSNQLNWVEPPAALGSPFASGLARFSKTHVRFSVRAEAGYDVRPVARLATLALVAEAPLGAYLASAGINQATAQAQTRLLGAVHKNAGRFGFGVLGSYQPGQGVALTLSVLAGLQRDEQAGRWYSAAHPITGTGAASTRVFFDANDNGKLDPGERPIAGAAFVVNSAQHDVRTGGDGTAFVDNVPTYQETALALAATSFEDPFWMSRRPGVRFVSRPGSVAPIDFPIVVAGEITGTVYVLRDGMGHEMSGVVIELRDSAGVLVKSARSAYDGFYELSSIAPGRYTLAIEARQARRLGVAAPSRQVDLAPAGTILDGLTFLLSRTGAPPVAVAAVAPAGIPASPAARTVNE